MGKKRANERGGATPRAAASEEPNVDGRTKQASPRVGGSTNPSPPSTAGDSSVSGEGWVRVRVSVVALHRSSDTGGQSRSPLIRMIPLTACNTPWISSDVKLKDEPEKARAVNGRLWCFNSTLERRGAPEGDPRWYKVFSSETDADSTYVLLSPSAGHA